MVPAVMRKVCGCSPGSSIPCFRHLQIHICSEQPVTGPYINPVECHQNISTYFCNQSPKLTIRSPSVTILCNDQSFVCLVNVVRLWNRNVSCAQNIKCQCSNDLVYAPCTFILSKIRYLDRHWATCSSLFCLLNSYCMVLCQQHHLRHFNIHNFSFCIFIRVNKRWWGGRG
jgi:hypothetical protein